MDNVASGSSGLDRFQKPRDWVDDMQAQHFWSSSAVSSSNVIDIWDPKQRRERQFAEYLHGVLGVKSQQMHERNAENRLFPCNPRKKRFLHNDSCVLDLPYPGLLDWSKNGVLVGTVGDQYFIFDWQQQLELSTGSTLRDIRSCKFHPRDNILLLGTKGQWFEQQDISKMIRISKARCRCFMGTECKIISVDWSPADSSFVTAPQPGSAATASITIRNSQDIKGCSLGMLRSFTGENKAIGSWSGFVGEKVYTAKVSPDARHVATASEKSAEVHILVWPHLKYLTYYKCDGYVVKTVTWHPWRSALLGVGYNVRGRAKGLVHQPKVCLWNVKSKSEKQETKFEGSPRRMDNMLFNHCSGEMVLGVWSKDTTRSKHVDSSLVVMSDGNTVVDQSESFSGRFGTMVFSPDGTKLAVGTSLNDMMMYHFMPQNKKKDTAEGSRSLHAMPAHTDKLAKGFVLR